MPEIRLVAKGVVWFNDPEPIHRLMLLQSSATRSAYQAVHKHGLRDNDVKVHVKQHYMAELNQRYISDAVSRAKGIKQEGSIFGGKKNWKRLISGRMTKEEWMAQRNDQLYSRGDVTKNGNPNIRIVGDELWVNDPSTPGRWLRGRLFIPEKFEVDTRCYDARLTRRDDGRFDVTITWEATRELVETIPGAIGIDINPSGVAVAEVDGEGNLRSHRFLSLQRAQFACRDKRQSDVELMACEIVRLAERCHRQIIIEDLKFRKKKGTKKFNRMRHNFLFAKVTQAVERRALKRGIPTIKVNPAFTSDLGELKYEELYSLNGHCAAAMVIARRGLGITERQTFDVFREPRPKGKGFLLNLEGRGRSLELSTKAWGWMERQFLHPRNPSSQDRGPAPRGTEEISIFTETTVGKRPRPGCEPWGESWPTTGRPRRLLPQAAGP